jgi:hypothetical protein
MLAQHSKPSHPQPAIHIFTRQLSIDRQSLPYTCNMAHTSNGEYNDISTRMSQASPLLNLPPELRNIIYREVLVSDEPIEANLSCRGTTTRLGVRQGLLQICRQIHEEAHDIFWSENRFHFTSPNYTVREVDNLLRRVDCRKAAPVTNLTIELQCYYGYQVTLEGYSMLVPPPSHPALMMDTISVILDAYRLLIHGVPASSIKLVQPCMPVPSAPASERFLATIHEEFNREFEETIRRPVAETHERLMGKRRTRFRDITIGNLRLGIKECCVE